MKQRRSLSTRRPSLSERTSRTLQLIGLLMALIMVRVWHLSVVQHEERLDASRRPQRKEVVERAERGTIRDRFNSPLAINKVQYNAAVLYSEIKKIPRFVWKKGETGQRVRVPQRKRYIAQLSHLFAEVLELSANDVEDLIYSRAALFHQVPYVIKHSITEAQYYRLKGLEREWLGVTAERVAKREYPQGRVGSDVIGYMGAISREQYDELMIEIRSLEAHLQERDLGEAPLLPKGYASVQEVRDALYDLEEKAYRLDDFVGKTGIEGKFEKKLRGYYGKRVYSSDARGNYLKELPGARAPVPGQRLLLSISSELQEFCEQLLIQTEETCAGSSKEWNRSLGKRTPLLEPWIRGGAIVVMDPNNGELLAMASHPRFDPNDFISRGEKRSRILRWFELDQHVAEIWDGIRPLEKETSQGEVSVPLDWNHYLSLLLPSDHPVHALLTETPTLRHAIAQMRNAEPPDESHKKLHLDLLRLVVDEEQFPEELLASVGDQDLSTYRAANAATLRVERATKKIARKLFHKHQFRDWREAYGRDYLRKKRAQERDEGRYQKPYLEYFERLERKLFARFWEKNRWPLLLTLLHGKDETNGEPFLAPYRDALLAWANEPDATAHDWYASYLTLRQLLADLSKEESIAYLRTMRRHQDLTRPLIGRYPGLRNEKGQQQLKHLASGFYPRYGFGYARSHAFRQAAPQGSIFKVVTGYEALIQRYDRLGEEASLSALNPLTIHDESVRQGKGWQIGTFMDGRTIPSVHNGGRIIPSLSRRIGECDLLTALERSSNPYFSLLAGEHLSEPNDLNIAALQMGYGSKTGIELPGELAGQLPRDLETNRSGLYSYAIGQHTLIVTPLQTAVMLSALANGGRVMTPKILSLTAGKEPIRNPTEMLNRREYQYQDQLALAGIDFPLFTEAEERESLRLVEAMPSNMRRRVPLPEPVRDLLLRGMERVVTRSKQKTIGGLVELYRDTPWIYREFQKDQTIFVGKSSTAESKEYVGIRSDYGAATYNRPWFGAITFSSNRSPARYADPELVIVIYQRYGGMGHDLAPLVTQISDKWREIHTAL